MYVLIEVDDKFAREIGSLYHALEVGNGVWLKEFAGASLPIERLRVVVTDEYGVLSCPGSGLPWATCTEGACCSGCHALATTLAAETKRELDGPKRVGQKGSYRWAGTVPEHVVP